MLKGKFSIAMILSAVTVTQISAEPSTVTPIVGSRAGTVVAGSPGEFNINNQDVSRLIDTQMREYFSRQKEDKEFFESRVNDLETSFNSMYKQFVVEAKRTSQNAQANGSGVDLQFMIALSADFANAKSAYENKIKALEAITKGALPSAQVMVTAQANTTIPAYRSINVDTIVSYYRGRISEMEKEIQGISFVVQDKTGRQQTVTVLNFDIKNFYVLSTDEITMRQNKITALKRTSPTLKAHENDLTVSVIKSSKVFIEQMGLNERFRSQRDEDLKARDDYYKQLSDMFFIRSYLRYKFGQNIGSMSVQFKKSWFHINEWLDDPKSLVDISDLPIHSQTDMLRSKENFRGAVAVSAKKSDAKTPGTSEILSQIFDGDFSSLTNANSLNTILTRLRGREALVQVAFSTLSLMAADVNEELILMTGGGHQKLRDYFKQRYMSNADNKKAVLALICDYDNDDSVQAHCPTNNNVNNDGTDGNSAKGRFNIIVNDFTPYLAQLQQAADLQKQLDDLIKLGANTSAAKVKAGTDDLFNN